jgi:hypothetical protein
MSFAVSLGLKEEHRKLFLYLNALHDLSTDRQEPIYETPEPIKKPASVKAGFI